MKIAMMTNNYLPFIGGVPISIQRLSDGLRREGHTVTVLRPHTGSRRLIAMSSDIAH